MMKSWSIALGVLLLITVAHAQRIDPSVIAVSGGYSATSAAQVSWTVGQTAVESYSFHGGAFTEGFQLPFLTVIPVRLQPSPFSLQLYPNPARYSLLVRMDGVSEDLGLVLYNLLGEPVLRHDVRSGDRMARLTLSSLPVGLYLLVALSPSGERLAVYKIVKAE